MNVQIASNDPRAEELLVLHIVESHVPKSERQPFILENEIDEAMKPHPGPTPRGVCFKYGWVRKPIVNKKVPADALEVTDLGREMMGRRKFAATTLDADIVNEEIRMRQFRKLEHQTNLPRLRALKAWLRGEQATWARVEDPAAPKPEPMKPEPKPAAAAPARRQSRPAPKKAPAPKSVLAREPAEA